MTRYPRDPLDALDLTRRLPQNTRPGSGVPGESPTRRRPFTGTGAAVAAAMAVAGGGGGGGGHHGGNPQSIEVAAVEGSYPLFSDDFEGAGLGGWTQHAGTWVEAVGLCSGSGSPPLTSWKAVATYDATAGIDDIEVFVTLASATIANAAVGARMDNAASQHGYFTLYTGTELRLIRGNSTSGVVIASQAIAAAQGDQIGVRCYGTTIQALLNGATILSVTDATTASGLCGLAVYTTTASRSFDDWGTR